MLKFFWIPEEVRPENKFNCESPPLPTLRPQLDFPTQMVSSTRVDIKKPRTLSEVFTLPLTYSTNYLRIPLLLRCGQLILLLDYRNHHSYIL